MINPATLSRDELNSFTQIIKDSNGTALVRLRDGTLIKPIFKEAEDDTCHDAFFGNDYRYCWSLDGTSITRADYDMMEIVG